MNPSLDVLSAILGDGKTSRLYRTLVFDKQVASEVEAGDVRRWAWAATSSWTSPPAKGTLRCAEIRPPGPGHSG